MAQIESTIENGTLTIQFEGVGALVITEAMVNAEIRNYAVLHGLKQKIGDAAAIARNTETGRPATINDKYAASREVFERMINPDGTWNKIRGGEGTGNATLLVRALMELSGKTREEVTTNLATKTAEQKKALAKNERVATIIARMQAATVDKTIDTDSMLNDLLG